MPFRTHLNKVADSSKYLQSGHHSAHSRDIVAIRVGSPEGLNISCMMGKPSSDETDSTDLKEF